MANGDRRLLLTLSGDVHLKSSRTRRRFHRILRENLQRALAPFGSSVELHDGPPGRWSLVPTADAVDLREVATVAGRVFGIYRVELVREIPAGPLDDLVEAAASRAEPRVAGRVFAVRARMRGAGHLPTVEVERALGARLLPTAAGVDLDHPEVTVRVFAWSEVAFVEEDRFAGSDGLPLRTQPPLLGMHSGGFDSAVAAWMLMRRGTPLDFVHFVMDCAQSEHAIAVAWDLWHRWGSGTEPTVWVVDFQEVKEHLATDVDPRHRQVALKRLMLDAAERLAARNHHQALVTGDSVGQVSTQTVANLVQIERERTMPVFRPLVGFTKEEILARAREIGTHDLSARAREVCDLSSGPVETAARRGRLQRAMADLPDDLVERALASSTALHLPTWLPGELDWRGVG